MDTFEYPILDVNQPTHCAICGLTLQKGKNSANVGCTLAEHRFVLYPRYYLYISLNKIDFFYEIDVNIKRYPNLIIISNNVQLYKEEKEFKNIDDLMQCVHFICDGGLMFL